MICLHEFSLDGNKLVSKFFDKTVGVRDVTTEALIHTLDGHSVKFHRLWFSPDGNKLATAPNDDIVVA